MHSPLGAANLEVGKHWFTLKPEIRLLPHKRTKIIQV